VAAVEDQPAEVVAERGVWRAASPERSGGVHFAGLDGYRAIAALMVVVTHVAFATGVAGRGPVGSLLSRMDFGVTLFFLLSGFLLYRPWAVAATGAPRPQLRRYAVRRAARVLPLYWVVVVAVLALLPEIQPVSPQDWAVHLLALQIYTPAGPLEGLTQTWSLATEIAFYVALPVIAAVLVGRRARSARQAWRRQMVGLAALASIGLAFVCVVAFTELLPVVAGYWLPYYLAWFAAGMALAVVEVALRQPDPPRAARWLRALAADPWACVAAGGAVLALAATPLAGSYDFSPTGPWQGLAKHLLYLVAGVLLLLPGVLTADRGPARSLAAPIPRRLGLISYGVFLWHLPVLRVVAPALGVSYFTGGTVLLLVSVLTVTLALAAVTYALVERPAQRWAHRR
jgi:peptidoglycan/LPS O-acetylase OafA/YrhL